MMGEQRVAVKADAARLNIANFRRPTWSAMNWAGF
jgi:hypothetical protein